MEQHQEKVDNVSNIHSSTGREDCENNDVIENSQVTEAQYKKKIKDIMITMDVPKARDSKDKQQLNETEKEIMNEYWKNKKTEFDQEMNKKLPEVDNKVKNLIAAMEEMQTKVS